MTRHFSPRALLPVLSICSLWLLAGCSRENDDWRSAQATDTAAAYQQFSREHPASAHAAEADARAVQLVEDEDWRRAQEDDSQQAYQQFVTQHPESHWVQEARVRIETISLGNAAGGVAGAAAKAGAPQANATPPVETPAGAAKPAPVPTPPKVAAPAPAVKAAPAPPAKPAQAPAAKAPATTAKPAATAAAAGAPFTGVQLGAFGSESAAHNQWTALAGKHRELAGRNPRVAVATTASGRLYRLQTATKDEAEARELCRTLSAAGQACVVVHP